MAILAASNKVFGICSINCFIKKSPSGAAIAGIIKER